MGPVHLTVADLGRSLDYYARTVGLQVHDRQEDTARLGVGADDLLLLTEVPGARPADGYAGLFHFALRLPDRASLAAWLAHAARGRVPLTGLSDHAVSEAVYLRDPDHHGVGLSADRPRAQWEGRVAELMTTAPLDTDDLLPTGRATPSRDWPGGRRWAMSTSAWPTSGRQRPSGATSWAWRSWPPSPGRRASTPAAATTITSSPVWESRGAPPAPAGHATLVDATLVYDDPEARAAVAERVGGETVLDPSGLRLRLA